jgi:ATP-dependent Lon protease
MLNYITMFKNKNDKDNNNIPVDKNNKKDKNDKKTPSGPTTRSSIANNNKRKRKEPGKPSNKYKKNYPSDSDSESERDYDYNPSERDSSSESDSDSESLDESESELLKENKKLEKQNKKRKINNSKKEEPVKDFDYENIHLNSEEEYEKYLEKIAEEMGDTIYNNVKNQLNDNKKGDSCDIGENCPETKDITNKGSVGTILILSQSQEPPDKLPKGYNLRKNTGQFEVLSVYDKKKIDETEKALFELNRYKIPPRHKVLLSSMTLSSKAKIIKNMERVENMNSYSSEYTKLTTWIDSILKVPFDKYYELPISITSPNQEIKSYLSNIESVMNKCIFSQNTAKEKILEFVGKWITNPGSTNEPIAFVGEKGTGKTTLAKEGIAKALGRPFFMISLGGESDASSFKGHDYTYEGSRWGRIVDILISTQCMNPVIFFDELDKLSTTRAGEEITGMLMHLTDTTQNDTFSDKYFSGIDFDLSKALFIFSYNDADKLNPILRDRLTEIQFTSFQKEDKLVIAKDFLINKACENTGLKMDNFILEDNTILKLIEKYTPREESGVRSLKRIIETLFLRINLFQLPHDLNISYKNMKFKLQDGKYHITDDIISQLLQDMVPYISPAILSMYM